VLSGSTADRAGFARGDIIVGYNGMDVVDSDELVRLVGETRIGSTATIVVLRRGKRTELKVPIEQRRQPSEQRRPR
jgi:serine protease Do